MTGSGSFRILVIDGGGGTLDISIADISYREAPNAMVRISVVRTAGDAFLGGADLRSGLVPIIADRLGMSEEQRDVHASRLAAAAEAAVRQLCAVPAGLGEASAGRWPDEPEEALGAEPEQPQPPAAVVKLPMFSETASASVTLDDLQTAGEAAGIWSRAAHLITSVIEASAEHPVIDINRYPHPEWDRRIDYVALAGGFSLVPNFRSAARGGLRDVADKSMLAKCKLLYFGPKDAGNMVAAGDAIAAALLVYPALLPFTIVINDVSSKPVSTPPRPAQPSPAQPSPAQPCPDLPRPDQPCPDQPCPAQPCRTAAAAAAATRPAPPRPAPPCPALPRPALT